MASQYRQFRSMKKTFNSADTKPKSLKNPQSFAEFSACIGYYSLRGKYPEALELVNQSLSKFKSRAERYEILCMAGDCQKNQKIWGEAESLFKIAEDSAYEPVAARARLGLAECELVKGNVVGAEKSVYSLIDEARSSQKKGLVASKDGGYAASALPMSPSAIAMGACTIFDKYGHKDRGLAVLEYSINGDFKGSARASGMLAKRKEQSDPSGAKAVYEQLLLGGKLGTREVDFLGGLFRVHPAISNQEVASYIEKFRPIAKPRAMFTVATAFRIAGRPEWVSYASQVSNPFNFSKKAKKLSDHILAVEALKLLNKEAAVNKDWSAVSQFSAKILGSGCVSSPEVVAAIRSIATSDVLRSGSLDASKITDLCDKAKNQRAARYGVARAMMQIEDFTEAERVFSEILADEATSKDWKSRARFNLADCYEKTGKVEQSLQMYEDILKDPDLDQKFAVIAATKMIGPLSKTEGGGEKVISKINELVDKTNDYVSLLDMARIIKVNDALPADCYERAYKKGKALAVKAIDSAKTPDVAMKTIFLLGRRQRDLLFYKEFVEDCREFAESRLEWLSKAPAPYWEYGAFAFEILNAMNRPVEADETWSKFVAQAAKKPSGVELSHYHLFKGIVNLNRGSSVAKAEFSKVIELAPLHVNASRAYYWLALVDRGNGKVNEATTYASRGLSATGVQGGYVWQQKLRMKLSVLANNFNIEKAAPGKNHLVSYKKVAGEVLVDLKKVEKLIG